MFDNFVTTIQSDELAAIYGYDVDEWEDDDYDAWEDYDDYDEWEDE